MTDVRRSDTTGMGQTGTQLTEVRTKNKISQRIPLLTLQGTFDIKKLTGVCKMMMSGSNRVKAEKLNDIIKWYDSKNESHKIDKSDNGKKEQES